MKPKPDEIVAARIVEELQGRNLVPLEKLASLGEGLARGSLSSEDWALLVELGLDRSTGGGGGAH